MRARAKRLARTNHLHHLYVVSVNRSHHRGVVPFLWEKCNARTQPDIMHACRERKDAELTSVASGLAPPLRSASAVAGWSSMQLAMNGVSPACGTDAQSKPRTRSTKPRDSA